MNRLFLVVGFLALSTVVLGQIGVTREKAISRYGQPVADGKHSILTAEKKAVALGPWLSFHSGAWLIRCDFVDGRCVRTAYSPRDDRWRESDIQKLLASNAQGETWTPREPDNPKLHSRAWRRSDGATATFGANTTGLSIAAVDYQRARQAAGAAPTLEGWAGPGPIPPKTEPNQSLQPTAPSRRG